MIVRALLTALVALALAVTAGHFLASDPGFVVIGHGGRVVRMSLALFVFLSALGTLALYVALHLLGQTLGLRRRLRQWRHARRRRRAYRSLTQGLLARAAGDYGRAERLFSAGASHDGEGEPQVHYLAAAEAAHAAHARGRRDNYLRLARDLDSKAAPALDLRRAEWLLDTGDLEAAEAAVAGIVASQPSTPALLRLRMRLLELKGDHAALLALVPALRRDRALSFDAAMLLERDCAVAVLAAAETSPATLEKTWSGLTKDLKANSAVVAAYARGLVRAGRYDDAEAVVASQLERRWDSQLVELYGEIPCPSASRQLRRVEAWARHHEQDRGLRLARARAAMREKLWGPARTQLEILMEEAPSALACRLLAEIADQTSDPDLARKHRERGLALATAS